MGNTLNHCPEAEEKATIQTPRANSKEHYNQRQAGPTQVSTHKLHRPEPPPPPHVSLWNREASSSQDSTLSAAWGGGGGGPMEAAPGRDGPGAFVRVTHRPLPARAAASSILKPCNGAGERPSFRARNWCRAGRRSQLARPPRLPPRLGPARPRWHVRRGSRPAPSAPRGSPRPRNPRSAEKPILSAPGRPRMKCPGLKTRGYVEFFNS